MNPKQNPAQSYPPRWFYDDHRNRRLEARDHVATLAIAAEALAEFLAHHEGHPLGKCDRAALVVAVAGQRRSSVDYSHDTSLVVPWEKLKGV